MAKPKQNDFSLLPSCDTDITPDQVNTGNYRKAVELFRGLLTIRPGLVGAHLGLGSALALLGGMENAVASFSAAIEVIITVIGFATDIFREMPRPSKKQAVVVQTFQTQLSPL